MRPEAGQGAGEVMNDEHRILNDECRSRGARHEAFERIDFRLQINDFRYKNKLAIKYPIQQFNDCSLPLTTVTSRSRAHSALLLMQAHTVRFNGSTIPKPLNLLSLSKPRIIGAHRRAQPISFFAFPNHLIYIYIPKPT